MEEAVAPSARADASSAAASARRLVASSAEPSTATTTSVVPRKMRRPRGSLIARRPESRSVAPALLGVGLAVLVEMGLELEAARVELDGQLRHAVGRNLERPRQLRRPLVPCVQGIAAGRYRFQREGAVARGLSVPR